MLYKHLKDSVAEQLCGYPSLGDHLYCTDDI